MQSQFLILWTFGLLVPETSSGPFYFSNMGAFSESQGILFDFIVLKYFCKCSAPWTIALTLINQQFKVATVCKPKEK